ncbi:MAG TPA: hypothetical protein PLW97_11210 [Synergistaceae bacterium]|nr:hypothetical protein [Synergistaceae bacterium]HPQ38199.1 hypothetical protein [Synergistaceae bacterium]
MKTDVRSFPGQFYQKILRAFLPQKSFLLLGALFLGGGILFLWFPHYPREIVIGLAYSTNPENQFMESRMFSSARAYVDWHNENTRGKKIRLVTASYLMDPTVALGELKEQGALGIVGFSSSSSVMEGLDAAVFYELPLVAVSASSSFLSRKDDWLFRVRSSTAEDAREIISLFGSEGISEIALVSFSGNPGYVVPFVWDLKKRGEPRVAREFFDLSLMEREPFRDENPFSAPRGVLVVGPPVYSLWIAQKARYLWPSSQIVLSQWSLAGMIPEKNEDFPLDFSVLGADTFFPFLVNKQHPFVRYWESRFAPGVDTLVNNTYLAFSLLLDALKESGFSGGEELRQSLAQYRKLSGLAGEIEIDHYGDAHAAYYLYRFGPRGYEKVSPR